MKKRIKKSPPKVVPTNLMEQEFTKVFSEWIEAVTACNSYERYQKLDAFKKAHAIFLDTKAKSYEFEDFSLKYICNQYHAYLSDPTLTPFRAYEKQILLCGYFLTNHFQNIDEDKKIFLIIQICEAFSEIFKSLYEDRKVISGEKKGDITSCWTSFLENSEIYTELLIKASSIRMDIIEGFLLKNSQVNTVPLHISDSCQLLYKMSDHLLPTGKIHLWHDIFDQSNKFLHWTLEKNRIWPEDALQKKIALTMVYCTKIYTLFDLKENEDLNQKIKLNHLKCYALYSRKVHTELPVTNSFRCNKLFAEKINAIQTFCQSIFYQIQPTPNELSQDDFSEILNEIQLRLASQEGIQEIDAIIKIFTELNQKLISSQEQKSLLKVFNQLQIAFPENGPNATHQTIYLNHYFKQLSDYFLTKCDKDLDRCNAILKEEEMRNKKLAKNLRKKANKAAAKERKATEEKKAAEEKKIIEEKRLDAEKAREEANRQAKETIKQEEARRREVKQLEAEERKQQKIKKKAAKKIERKQKMLLLENRNSIETINESLSKIEIGTDKDMPDNSKYLKRDMAPIKMPFLVVGLLTKIRENGYEGYYVGGGPRDAILLPDSFPTDYDIVTNCPILILEKIINNPLRKCEHFSNLYQYDTFDITIKERLDLFHDALGRDFTINSVYCDERGYKYIPLPETVEDLKDKMPLRTIDNASQSFLSDPIRILRSIELSNKVNRELSPEIINAIADATHMLIHTPNGALTKHFKKLLLSERGYINYNTLTLLNVQIYSPSDLNADHRTFWKKHHMLRDFVREKLDKLKISKDVNFMYSLILLPNVIQSINLQNSSVKFKRTTSIEQCMTKLIESWPKTNNPIEMNTWSYREESIRLNLNSLCTEYQAYKRRLQISNLPYADNLYHSALNLENISTRQPFAPAYTAYSTQQPPLSQLHRTQSVYGIHNFRNNRI